VILIVNTIFLFSSQISDTSLRASTEQELRFGHFHPDDFDGLDLGFGNAFQIHRSPLISILPYRKKDKLKVMFLLNLDKVRINRLRGHCSGLSVKSPQRSDWERE